MSPASSNSIKILIVGDSPCIGSGMAEVLRLLFGRLIERYPGKYIINQIALQHIYAIAAPKWSLYPTKTIEGNAGLKFDENDYWGNLSILERVDELSPDILFIFNDPQRVCIPIPKLKRRVKVVVYTNYDGVPIYDDSTLREADAVYTMSKFALNVFRKNHSMFSSANSGFVYAPCDTGRFSKIEECMRGVAKQNHLPGGIAKDSFVIGWVGRNCWRKQIWVIYKIARYIRYGGYWTCNNCGKVTVREWDAMAGRYMSRRQGVSPKCWHCDSDSVVIARPLKRVVFWIHMPRDDRTATWPTQLLEREYALIEGIDIIYTSDYRTTSGLPPEDMPILYQVLIYYCT